MTDWSPLGWYEDPVPGSPDSVQDGADAMAAVATTISEAAENLRSIAASEGQVSLAVDAFRERALEVAGQIELVHDRYSGAADALSGYVEPLRSAQSLAREALEEATAARTAILPCMTSASVGRSPLLRFVLHYLEMVVAMVVGMMALAPLWPDAWLARGDMHAVAMAVDMTVAMAAWMAIRRHAWPRAPGSERRPGR